MWPRLTALAGLSVWLGGTTAVGALDLEYRSHIPLYVPEIGLTEPSGLSIDPDGSGFWIVSDNARTVFRLDKSGDIGAYLGQDDRLQDLEGIAVDAANRRLLVVSENTGRVITVSLNKPHRIHDVEVGALEKLTGLADAFDDNENGLEGITLAPDHGGVLVAKEKNPRLLVEIGSSLERLVSVDNLEAVLPKEEDISGLAFDPVRDGLWILSDIGKSVHFVPKLDGNLRSFKLHWLDGDHRRRLDNPEGVALSPDGRSLFVVTDDDENSRLLQYDIIDAKAADSH
ncbi:MAG: SdiA-regulated domain-containing protein [Dinoroseobacter sp.]|nr:SdiA-regulated domain-containing protein [Dinoroseobacter sp.]